MLKSLQESLKQHPDNPFLQGHVAALISIEEANARCSAANGSGRPKFEIHRYNSRRAARGAEAVEMKVTWPDGEWEYLWMSKRDIRENIVTFGVCDGLNAALKAYSQNDMDEGLRSSASSTTTTDL